MNSIDNFETKPIPKPEPRQGTRPRQNFNCCLTDKTNHIRSEEEITEPLPISKDLFVFGKPQGDTVFKFTKFLGGVGSTVKRLFGFKS